MNLQCPNCQKLLTVPEQYAGQLMKCPLCGGTFTVPGLPSAPAPEPAPAAVTAAAAAAPSLVGPPEPAAAPAAAPAGEIYSFKDPVPAPAPTLPPPPVIMPNDKPAATEPVGVVTVPVPMEPESSTAPSTTPRGEYTKAVLIWFSPKFLQWVPSACLLVILFHMFVPWTGVYAGSYGTVTQSGWSTAWGWSQTDPDLLKEEIPIGQFDVKEVHGSTLMGFYVLLFFPVLILTIGALVLNFVKLDVPALKPFLPWRWGIVAIANLVLFLFLFLQSLTSFGVEARYREEVNELPKIKDAKKEGATSLETKQLDAYKAWKLSALQRTTWWTIVFDLSLLSAVVSVMMYWLDQREKSNRPLPRLDVLW